MFGLRRGSLGWLSLFVLLLNASQSRAQGTCACQPAEITFTLDFDLSCGDSNVLTGDPGINETLCVVFPPNSDEVPVSVSNISISEVDANFDVIKMVNYSDTFSTGDNITYISYIETNAESVENGTIPYALQVSIIGGNEAGDILTNSYAIVYTNDCSIYPVLDAGSQIGWTAITEVVRPPAAFCPAVSDSIVPSIVPSSIPSLAPVSADLCACQPNSITFVLDFSLNCDDRTILTGNPGIKGAECLIFPDSVDPIPVVLESVQLYETDLDLNLINMVNYNETFSSGDMITYESAGTGSLISTGITVELNGVNGDGEKVTNSFVILYTNECDVYPVLVDGDQIGWTKLQMLVPPSPEFCPAAPLETLPPSASIVPSGVPSDSPVMSIVPSNVPSDPFTMGPTDSMVETESPVAVPVEPPAKPPVEAPVEPPAKAPVEPPNKGMKGEGMMMMMEGMKKDMSSKDNMSMDINKKGMMGGKGMSDDSSSGKGMSKASMGKGTTEDDDSTKGKGMSKDGSSKGKGMSKGKKEPKKDKSEGGKGENGGKREKEKEEHKDKLHMMMGKGEGRQLRYTSE